MTTGAEPHPAPLAGLPRIRGSLGEKVLAKAPELFNQGLDTVLAEALQNSRRAGATRVEAELLGEPGRQTLVLRDDGCGIVDMVTLVQFGASAWDERTDVAENAAGMGVFSLASRGVTVRSRGQRVALTRAVFCGEADATVLPDPALATGTELRFPVTEHGAELKLEQACRFYPLPVTLNGRPLVRADFLAGAAYVAEWQGLRIGVFRNHGPRVTDLFGGPLGRDGQLFLNFHGHVVACGGAVKLAEAVGPAWIAFADVVDAPDLRLVLPARNEAIENDFLRALRGRAERAILECVARQPCHALAFQDAQRAARLGIALPPVRIALQDWVMPSDELGHRCRNPPYVLGEPEQPALLLDPRFGLETHEEANLHGLLAGWQGSARVLRGNEAFAGYPAYDALAVVAGLDATVTAADGSVRQFRAASAEGEEAPDESGQKVVTGITARLLVRSRGQPHEPPTVAHEAAMPFLFTSEADGYEMPGLVVVRGTNPADLAGALRDCFFCHSDDSEADSYDRQVESYASEARDFARELLLSSREAAAARVIEGLQDMRWSLRTVGAGTIEVRIAADRSGTIRITSDDGQETTAAL